jgi:type I restriction enzyme M protein
MAPNLFYGTGLAPCIIILRAKKRNERVKKILVINAETLFKRGRNQNTLEREFVDKILALYSNFKSVEGLAKLAPINEIKQNNFNLNIPLYVTPIESHEQLSLKQCLSNLDLANKQVQESRSDLLEELQKWGLNVKR